MSRSSFSFNHFQETIIRIVDILVRHHNTPAQRRPRFQEVFIKVASAHIFCKPPYSHIQAPIWWEVSTKGEWTRRGYVVYIKLQQAIHRDGEPFIERLLVPELGISDVQDWLKKENITLYSVPKTKSDALNITLAFYVMPRY